MLHDVMLLLPNVAFAADSVVVALGRVPEDGLARSLRATGVPFQRAGDCRSPRGLEEAILEGTLAVRRPSSPAPARV
jgi:hypothetical protein